METSLTCTSVFMLLSLRPPVGTAQLYSNKLGKTYYCVSYVQRVACDPMFVFENIFYLKINKTSIIYCKKNMP